MLDLRWRAVIPHCPPTHPTRRQVTSPTRWRPTQRAEQERRPKPYTPVDVDRPISAALRASASMATSASDGAYRKVPE